MFTYATVDDLDAWPAITTVPDDAEALLQSASIVVALAVNESLYNDSTIVTDPKRDATCAQVASWVTTGIRPGTAGLSSDKVLRSKNVENVTLEYDTSLSASVTAFQARQDVAGQLCPEAEAILRSAQILWEGLPVWNGTPAPGLYVSELGQVGGYFGGGLAERPYGLRP